MTTPGPRNLITPVYEDEYEGLATRVTVHETIRSKQGYVEVGHKKVVIHEYRTKNPLKLKICKVSGDDTKNKRTMDI